MRLAAEWGYNMARIGFQEPPVPVIAWHGNEPMIQFGASGASGREHLVPKGLPEPDRAERLAQLLRALRSKPGDDGQENGPLAE